MASSKQVTGPVRGVNLGGWLVLEPWLTPSLFVGTAAVDEHSFCAQADAARLKLLHKHRAEYITKNDFVWLAKQGIQSVRLPVGYWLFGDEKPYHEAASYVAKALDWAADTGLTVLLDLHGAPGSQNGTMHSGHRGTVGWLENNNQAHTLAVLQKIAKRFGKHSALVGISVLNEPSKQYSIDTLEAFYKVAYAVLAAHAKPGLQIVVSDGFRPQQWRRRLPAGTFPQILLDHHYYQLTRWFDRYLTSRTQVLRTHYWLPRRMRNMQRAHPVIIGEWSLALPAHITKPLTEQRRAALYKKYGQMQLKGFESTQAWYFWTYKTEGGGPWSFRFCIEHGLLEPKAVA